MHVISMNATSQSLISTSWQPVTGFLFVKCPSRSPLRRPCVIFRAATSCCTLSKSAACWSVTSLLKSSSAFSLRSIQSLPALGCMFSEDLARMWMLEVGVNCKDATQMVPSSALKEQLLSCQIQLMWDCNLYSSISCPQHNRLP